MAEIMAECSSCGNMYDFGREISENDGSRKVYDVVKECYGSLVFLCDSCI